jgi:hypothetical protein
MSSPDFSQYVDLTLYDVEPQDVYSAALTYAQTALPEFIPVIGTVEDAVLQATSYMTYILAAGINRVPNGVMEGIIKLMGFSRNEATFATGSALFTLSVNTGTTIPEGTIIAYTTTIDNEVVAYSFATTTDTIVPSGSDTVSIAIEATEEGQYPTLLDTQQMILISSVPTILEVSLDADIVNGINSETDAQYFDRAAQFLSSINTSLATKRQLVNYIAANYPTVNISAVYDTTNSAGNLLFATAAAPGYVTIAVAQSDGTALGSTIKNALQTDVAGKAIAGLNVGVIDITTFSCSIAVSIAVVSGYTPATVQASVADAIESYISPLGWDQEQTINPNKIVALIAVLPGVGYVSSVTLTIPTSPANVTLASNVITIAKKAYFPVGIATVTVI